MTGEQVRDFIGRPDKRLVGDVELQPASEHAGAFAFRGHIVYSGGPEVGLQIWFNPYARDGKISIAYFGMGIGRIYGLCVNISHICVNISHSGMELHKHSGPRSVDQPYVPNDITAPASNPQGVRREFCAETGLIHDGDFRIMGRERWALQTLTV